MITSVRLMLNKGRRLNSGSYPLVFQVIHNRRKKLLYSGYHIKEEAFDKQEEKIIASGADSAFSVADIAKMNRELRKIRSTIHTRIWHLKQTRVFYTVEDILTPCVHKNVKQQFYLLRYIDAQIERKKELKKDGMAAAYKSTRSSLAKFLNNSDIRIPAIDLRFVRRYEDFLYSTGVTSNTISYYLRNFRILYNQAIVDGCHSHNEYPFVKAQTRPEKTVKRALTRENLQSLANLMLEDASELEFSRDLYLFSFYAQGMAFVDIVLLKKSSICNGILTYSRHKSKQLIRIAVTPQMREIMDKYKAAGEYIFPILDKQDSSEYKLYRLALGRINRHLRRIAAMANIKVPLTTYTARHTWATLAHDYGAPVSVISAGLGHTSEEMTRIYLKEFDVSLLDKVNSMVTNLS